jgi:enoyl-CoA hydratase/carnithine racemase
MSILEIERQDAVMLIRMNRPERLNALGSDLRAALADAWCEFRDSNSLEVAIFTGAGRAFCAGEDMKESVARGTAGSASAPGARKDNPYDAGTLEKPVIVAVNGYAMGGGFMLVERADLRVAVRGAVFESSEAKRWLLGGYDHGVKGRLPHTVATELAFAFRFTAERLHQVGFLNRVVEPDELLPTAREMAAHLLTLPPAARVNTTVMMRAIRPRVSEELEDLAARLKEHGAKEDLMESRRAFAEKRPPRFKGWDHPDDRHRTPKLKR